MAKRIGGRPYKKRLLPGLGYPIALQESAPAAPAEQPPDHVPFDWSDDIAPTIVSDGGYQQSDEPARPVEGAWDWDAGGEIDETHAIEATTHAPVGANAVLVAPQPAEQVDQFAAEEGYEDPIIDLVEASVGPVQPNAPPLNALPQDAPDFYVELEDLLPPDEVLGPDQPPVVDDAWNWYADSAEDEHLPLEPSPLGADFFPALAYATDWDWFTAPADDELELEPRAQDPGDLPEDPEWNDDDQADDWWHALDTATVEDPAAPAQDQQDADWWPWDVEADVDTDESAPVGADAPVLATITLGDDWAWEDLPAEDIEDSGPVRADAIVVVADQPPADDWIHDAALELEDLEPSGPVGENQPALQPDAWPWLDELADDEVALLEQPGAADEPAPQPDDWPHFDDVDADDWWHAIEPTVEGLLAAQPYADDWHWAGEDTEDDAWWQWTDHALVDLVLLAGPTYSEAWDWDGEETEDDEWWRDLPQPDPAALPVDTCPAQLAEAMARIAELEAQLADALARAGGGGGGGDDVVERYVRAWHDERRAKIEANNRLIMALVGAVVHGLEGPEGPT